MNVLNSNPDFKLMVIAFKIRDFFLPRVNILKEAGIMPGFRVLNFGCGPGGYVTPLSELVGKTGKIYALDINPDAIKMVQNLILKRHISNVETTYSNCKTGLPDNSIDVVILYDVFHEISEPDEVLRELRRVLKPAGTLSFRDHHIMEDEILAGVTGSGLFRLSKKGKRTYSFVKIESNS
jgi:ubiquinone/menaquinone biosynthesis C-methylase UbiE